MPLTRTHTWDTRELTQFLRERDRVPFSWGTIDCCLTPADAILAMTGTDIADDFRGKYSTEVEAFRLIREVTGGSTVADAAAHCAAKHGLVEWPSPLLAQRGDLVVIQDADRLIAGIVDLNGRHVVSAGAEGLKRLPASAVTRAWKV
jgi:hypothetical protein